MIWLSMRDLSEIDEIACTVPTASTMIGIDFGVTVITTTGTGPAAGRPGRPFGALSAAFAGAKPSLRSMSCLKMNAVPQTTTATDARPATRAIRILDPPNPPTPAALKMQMLSHHREILGQNEKTPP